jgi:hypothetical protein
MIRKILLTVLLAFFVLFAAVTFYRPNKIHQFVSAMKRAPILVPAAVQTEETIVRNNPVVKGGVDLPKILELMKKGFYNQVDASTLHAVIVKEDFMAFMQYRRGNSLFWSRNKVKVLKGSLLFCDAAGNCIVAKCGNSLSMTPETPIEIGLIAGGFPDVPEGLVLPPETFIPTEGGTVSEAPSGPTGEAPPIYSGGFCCGGGGPGGGSPGSPPTPPIVSTPEPQSFWLLAVGILILGIVRSL